MGVGGNLLHKGWGTREGSAVVLLECLEDVRRDSTVDAWEEQTQRTNLKENYVHSMMKTHNNSTSQNHIFMAYSLGQL